MESRKTLLQLLIRQVDVQATGRSSHHPSYANPPSARPLKNQNPRVVRLSPHWAKSRFPGSPPANSAHWPLAKCSRPEILQQLADECRHANHHHSHVLFILPSLLLDQRRIGDLRLQDQLRQRNSSQNCARLQIDRPCQVLRIQTQHRMQHLDLKNPAILAGNL